MFFQKEKKVYNTDKNLFPAALMSTQFMGVITGRAPGKLIGREDGFARLI